MRKPLVRLLAFTAKEINEVRRQPRLVLSLVFGPFLILLLFGIGYQGSQPQLRTALVLPPGGVQGLNVEALQKMIGANFQLVSADLSREQALAQLAADQLDVVQILPADIEGRALRGEPSEIEFTYNEINPLNQRWIEYLAYAEVTEVNRAILLRAATALQQEAARTSQQLAQARQQLDALSSGTAGAGPAQLRATLQRLRAAAAALALSPLLAQAAGGDAAQARRDLEQLQRDAEVLDQTAASGQLNPQHLRAMRDRIARLEETTRTLSAVPPDVIVSPVRQNYENLSRTSYDLVTFYTPGVMALLIQHIAVTLGALSLVRERALGATEIFRVAPVSIAQIITGKYLAYTIFIGVMAAALAALLPLLGVPFLGSASAFAGLVALLIVASLGIGFLISAVSKSDSQSIQLSMLVLLLSIFFSGFFLPLENFSAPVRAVGYLLPITHGIIGLQALMLRGIPPVETVWLALGAIALITFGLTLVLARRNLKRA